MTETTIPIARQTLQRLNDQLVRDVDARERCIESGWVAGLTVEELATLSPGFVARVPVDVIRVYQQTRKEEAFAATAELWESGVVIEDRYGLRWRADCHITRGERGWFCRSVGLRVFRTGEQMAERGPLKKIRRDLVFAGPEATAAREAGEKEDAEIIVAAGEDPVES